MVSVAVCQISILDEYVTNSPSCIQISTRSSVYAGVQMSFTRIFNFYTGQLILSFLHLHSI